ncbi:MAG: NAD-dependent epimerase/dehydratase family protein [Myxococcaceae bacterium]|jgi:nucleoside-diphosphate-sugar epimerase|nr:NAD-dependent epimerase/dehydratase family protein [Myxococcaceae bacterium]
MRVLITGANGFLGSWLSSFLAERKHEVRCLVRAGSDRSALTHPDVVVVPGDVTQPATLGPALEGVDVCYHLAGIRRGTTRDDFIRVNAEGTRAVAEALVAAKGRRLVLCGSLAASGPSLDEKPRREEEPFAPEEWYGESKAEAERVLFSFKDRLEVTSCRPSRIVGPGDHENLTFFKLAARGVILRLLGRERRISFVDVEDVVDQLVLQGERAEAVGQAFFCSSAQTETVESLMTYVAEALGVRARVVPVPEAVLAGAGALADVLSTVSGRKLPLNRKLARQLLAPGWTCSTEKATKVLGFTAKRSVRESMKRSGEWYRQQGWL